MRARRRLAGFLRRPTVERIHELAAEAHMTLAPDEAADMAILVDRYLAFADRVDDLPQPELPVRYPDRDKGSRPAPAEDPNNVFIRECRVTGAPAGRLSGWKVGVKDNISVALALEVIAGDDPKDAQWVRGPIRTAPYAEALSAGVEGLRIGILEEGFDPAQVEPDVAAACRPALDGLAGEGPSAGRSPCPSGPRRRRSGRPSPRTASR